MQSLSGLNVDFEVFVTPPTHATDLPGVIEAENVLVAKCLNGGWDYLWLVEGDIEVPEHAFLKLYGLGVDIACGYYPYHHDFNGLICGFLGEDMKVWHLPRKAVKGKILSGWVFAGAGCLLVKRRVFESGIKFRYKAGVGQDILFMFDSQRAGFVAKVHGDVECGHLPEWPLPKPLTLDVGCGHEPKGDVNVDLYPKASPHRSSDQRLCEDKGLNIKTISNFVQAHACYLPFREGAFNGVYSSHTIEHVQDAEGMIFEMLRVSNGEVEIVCPHARAPWGFNDRKPLHINALTSEWFHSVLGSIPAIEYYVHCNRFGEGPGDVFVKIIKKRCLDG